MVAAGTVARTIADRQAQRAMDRAQRAEMDRQDQFSAEQMGSFDKSVDVSTRAAQEKRIGDAVAERTDLFTDAVQDFAPTDALAGQADGPRVIQSETKRALGDAIAAGRAEGAARARLTGYGDARLGVGSEVQRRAGDIGLVSGLRRGSLGILPLELQAASRKGSGVRMLGDMLTMGGQVAAMGMGSGAFGGGAPVDRGGSAYPGSKY